MRPGRGSQKRRSALFSLCGTRGIVFRAIGEVNVGTDELRMECPTRSASQLRWNNLTDQRIRHASLQLHELIFHLIDRDLVVDQHRLDNPRTIWGTDGLEIPDDARAVGPELLGNQPVEPGALEISALLRAPVVNRTATLAHMLAAHISGLLQRGDG